VVHNLNLSKDHSAEVSGASMIYISWVRSWLYISTVP